LKGCLEGTFPRNEYYNGMKKQLNFRANEEVVIFEFKLWKTN
jgi:hypothetical protein